METAEMAIHSDGFNRVRTERPRRTPLKYTRKLPPMKNVDLLFHSSSSTVVCLK